jgi:hypothetical protein
MRNHSNYRNEQKRTEEVDWWTYYIYSNQIELSSTWSRIPFSDLGQGINCDHSASSSSLLAFLTSDTLQKAACRLNETGATTTKETQSEHLTIDLKQIFQHQQRRRRRNLVMSNSEHHHHHRRVDNIDLKFLVVSQARGNMHFVSKLHLRLNVARQQTSGLVSSAADRLLTLNLNDPTRLPFSLLDPCRRIINDQPNTSSSSSSSSSSRSSSSGGLTTLLGLLALLLFFLIYYGYEKIFELRVFNKDSGSAATSASSSSSSSSKNGGLNLVISDENFLVHVFDFVLFYFLLRTIYFLMRLIEASNIINGSSSRSNSGGCSSTQTAPPPSLREMTQLIESYEMLATNLGILGTMMLVPNLLNRYAFAIYTPVRVIIKVCIHTTLFFTKTKKT